MNQLGEAFSFPFRDKSWVSKFILGAVFMLLTIVVIGLFILVGYFVQVTQRVMRKDPNPLPEWDDIGVKLVLGFKFCVVYFVYCIPILILYVPFIVMTILSSLRGEGDPGGIFAGLFGMGFLFLTVPYTLALYILMPIITYRFAEHERIGDAFDISSIVTEFKRNWSNTLIVALIAIGIQYFSAVGIVVFIVGIFFTIMYSHLVSAYMYGALYLEQHQEGTVTA